MPELVTDEHFVLSATEVHQVNGLLNVIARGTTRFGLTVPADTFGTWAAAGNASAFYAAITKSGNTHVWANIIMTVVTEVPDQEPVTDDVLGVISCDELPADWVRLPATHADPARRYQFRAVVR